MDKACFEYNCYSYPEYFCKCVGKTFYYCSDHLLNHDESSPLLEIEPLTVSLNDRTRKEISSVIVSHKKKINLLKSQISLNSNLAINKIISESNEALRVLANFEEKYSLILRKFISTNKMNNKVLQYLKKGRVPDQIQIITDPERLFTKIKEAFEIEAPELYPIPETIDNNFLFYFDDIHSVYKKIDLEDYSMSVSKELSSIGNVNFSGGCALDNNSYFLHGGFQEKSKIREAVIVDFHLKAIAHVPTSNFQRSCSACVLKNSQIFVFSPENCEKISLGTMLWKKIQSLPSKALNLSGSLVANKMIVSGRGIQNFFVYDEIRDNYFEFNCDMHNGYKVVCENYIVNYDTIYEIDYGEKNQWQIKKYPCEWSPSVLAISIVFRWKKNLYFMDSKKNLIRLDTVEKKIQSIGHF